MRYRGCGYPNKMQHLGERMKENNMTLVMLEHYTQLQFAKIDGLLPLAEFNDYKAARSYVIDRPSKRKSAWARLCAGGH